MYFISLSIANMIGLSSWDTVSMNLLSKIHMLYSLKSCQITPLPPHNRRLSTTATFFSPWGGRCGEVWLYYQLTFFLNVLTARFRNLEWSYPVIPSRVSWSATAWNKQLPSPGISFLILRPERFIFSSSWRLCSSNDLFSPLDGLRNLASSDRLS